MSEEITVGLRKNASLGDYENVRTHVEVTVSNETETDEELAERVEELQDIVRDKVNKEIAQHRAEKR